MRSEARNGLRRCAAAIVVVAGVHAFSHGSAAASASPLLRAGAAPLLASALAADLVPLFVPPDTLRLERALEIALASSPELRHAEAQALGASAGRLEGWGRLVPSILVSTGIARGAALQRTATDPLSGRIVDLPEDEVELWRTYATQAAVSADWTLFTGGQQLLQIRRAEHEARAARLTLAAARARVGAGVTLAYLDALEADALRRVRQADLERAGALVDAAEARFEVGEAPEIDVLQARVGMNDADLALMEAEIQAEAARLVLAQYLAGGAPADGVLLAPARPAVLEWEPERIRACALRHSAELEAHAARARAGGTARTAAAWSFLPTIRAGATWARSEFGQTRDAITSEPRNENTTYRLTMSWTPLDQPGHWLANRRRAAALEAETAAALAVRRPAVERQVEMSLTRLQRARLLRERSELNLELAARQREHAAERYRVGVAPITEMIQAEALAREAERQAVTARFADLRALAEIETAAGVSLDALEQACAG
jgi:outer membrane protein